MANASDQVDLVALLGGEVGLRAIIDDFIDRVVSDMMIGFHFRAVDIPRLKLREFEFARKHLGGGGHYSGRDLRSSHAPHKVMGGHFNRRLVLLEKTLRDHDAPAEVIAAWLEHNEKLRSQITRDQKDECIG